jgi:hypothetical protein
MPNSRFAGEFATYIKEKKGVLPIPPHEKMLISVRHLQYFFDQIFDLTVPYPFH